MQEISIIIEKIYHDSKANYCYCYANLILITHIDGEIREIWKKNAKDCAGTNRNKYITHR